MAAMLLVGVALAAKPVEVAIGCDGKKQPFEIQYNKPIPEA